MDRDERARAPASGVLAGTAVASLVSRPHRARELGPLTRLDATTTPGARQLLARAELAAERGLHVARGIFWVFFSFVVLGSFGIGVPLLIYLALVAGAFAWVWIWRVLSLPAPPPWLKYALILLDGWTIVRAPIHRAIGLLPGATAGDLLAMSPPLLVYVALSGALRLDPWAAAFSTATALGGFAILAIVEQQPARQAVVVGATILFAGGIGIGVARVLRYVALRAREREVLGRYVPQTLTRELAMTGDPEQAGRQEDVTVLMVDMRGFTRLSERLTPGAAITLLNDYFGAVVLALAAEDAILDRYLGDGILAHFAGPERSARALRAAQGIRRVLDRFNAARPEREPIAVGIAIHAGSVLVGAIGAGDRRDYTIIGDAVNVADRLEKWNKQLESVIVASVEGLAGLGDPSRHGFVGPRIVTVDGRDEPIVVHHLPRSSPL